MLSQTLLIALAGTAAAMAPRPDIVKRALEARQTDEAGMSACLDAMQSLITAMPTPPPAVDITGDPCTFTVPKSLESAYSSYQSAITSWYTAHSSQWSSALAQCPDSDAFTSDLDSASSCTAVNNSGNSGSNGDSGSKTTDSSDSQETGSSSGSGSGASSRSSSGASPTATGGSNSSGSGSGSSSGSGNGNGNAGKNAAHRDTGLAGAAVAIAGVLGAVALL